MIPKFIVAGVCAVFCIVALTACQHTHHPDKKDAGWRCNTPQKGSGLVAGYFRGWQETSFQNNDSGLMALERYRCFKTRQDCTSWLQHMTYNYDAAPPEAQLCTAY